MTLALGIVALAMVSIFGSFSIGLNSLREANRDVTCAQIIAEVSSMVTQTPFAQLQTFVNGTTATPLYFDQGGRQLLAGAAAGQAPAGALYRATLSMVYPAAGSAETAPFPGAQPGLSASANSVQITVSNVFGGSSTSSSQAVVIVPKS